MSMCRMIESVLAGVCLLAVGCQQEDPAPVSEPEIAAPDAPATPDAQTEPGSPQSDSAQHHYLHKVEQPHAAEWGYKGDTGPDHWGDLDPGYILAKTGKHQSPIDITSTVASNLPGIEFEYHPSKIDLVYNGHTVEEIEDKHSAIDVDGRHFVLQQFHFHAPSEHTVDGKHFDMEMHLVHKSNDGTIAVVGVLIEAGDDNPAFDAVWNYLPTAENRERVEETSVDAATLLPEDRSYYRYTGSFTTPPCTEDVLWMVLKSPIQLSADQIAKFRAVISGNNRPTQPLNGREIAVSGS